MSPDNTLPDRFRGCLLGLAAGDAVGVPAEFKRRGSFEQVTSMAGGGPFDLASGEWTDETSMALCLAASLLECEGFDANDQMQRYLRWLDHGYMSSMGQSVDAGMTISMALVRYAKSGNPFSGPTNPNSAGNASIMRLAPVPMYYFGNLKAVLHYAGESSRTTHGAEECIDACRYLGLLMHRALSGEGKEEVLAGAPQNLLSSRRIQNIAAGVYREKTKADISSTCYVVQSLEAALWCFWMTDSFADAILLVTNLGYDSDTIAAICGQLAGAYYGIDSIPGEWLDALVMQEGIMGVADRLLEKATQSPGSS